MVQVLQHKGLEFRRKSEKQLHRTIYEFSSGNVCVESTMDVVFLG